MQSWKIYDLKNSSFVIPWFSKQSLVENPLRCAANGYEIECKSHSALVFLQAFANPFPQNHHIKKDAISTTSIFRREMSVHCAVCACFHARSAVGMW